MGEQIQSQEPIIANSPRSSIMDAGGTADDQHIHTQKPISIANSPRSIMGDHHIQSQQQQQQQQPIATDNVLQQMQLTDYSVEPTDLLSMLHLNSFNSSSSAATGYHHPPCAAASGSFGSNSMKRRSPSSSSGAAEPSAKKLFCDQEDLTLHGFSAISLPLTLGTPAAGKNANPVCPVLRRCVSDPSKPPAAGFPSNSPEHVNPATPVRGCGLPPLPPSLRRSVSDLTPSPTKSLSRSLSSEETPDSMRLRRMKDRLREMRQWWDEVMKDDEEQQDECVVAEDDKVPPQDELKGDSEEAVRVEWAEKCVSITFRCPCGKGYEVLLSSNNCYYKLV